MSCTGALLKNHHTDGKKKDSRMSECAVLVRHTCMLCTCRYQYLAVPHCGHDLLACPDANDTEAVVQAIAAHVEAADRRWWLRRQGVRKEQAK